MKKSSVLEELASRCDQAGTMNFLRHFIGVPTFRHKTACLVMGFDATQTLEWAVLMYELTPLGLRTGVFATDDISGFRTVISPARRRAEVASATADALLKAGALAVRISYLQGDEGGNAAYLRTRVAARWAVSSNGVLNTLILEDSYESTLMTMGKSTRVNMRYYRRKLASQLRCEVVADARGMFGKKDLLALNAEAWNPFLPRLAWMQYENMSSARDGFVFGLRAEDGRWLGLMGGWRQSKTTVLLWQMNRSGFDRESLGTVMRGYFIEHEVECGAERVVFFGGTPNSIQNAFREDRAIELLTVRRSRRADALVGVAKLLSKPRWWWSGSPNRVAGLLDSEELEWHDTGARDESMEPLES